MDGAYIAKAALKPVATSKIAEKSALWVRMTT